LLKELCAADLAGRRVEVAVLPVGATEVHGLHLPFGIDTINAEEIARRAAEAANARGADVLVLPAVPFGMDANLMAFPYTIDIRPATMIALVGDVVRSMAAHGVRKVLLLNGHGGNSGVLDACLRDLYGRVDAFVCRLDWWKVAEDLLPKLMESAELEHACEFETSVSLHTCPGLVRMERATPAPGNRHRLPLLAQYGGKFSRAWDLYTTTGGVGRPDLATAEKGRALVEATVERIASVLVELAQAAWDGRFPY
jgi:creatinine amidohydrolase